MTDTGQLPIVSSSGFVLQDDNVTIFQICQRFDLFLVDPATTAGTQPSTSPKIHLQDIERAAIFSCNRGLHGERNQEAGERHVISLSATGLVKEAVSNLETTNHSVPEDGS